MFTLTQWLQLAAVVALPSAAARLVTKGAFAMVDRKAQRYREIDKVLAGDNE